MDEKKNIIQDFKEKTAGMNFAGKLDYFWTYYKLATIITAFTAFVAISVVSGMIRNALTKPVLNTGVVSDVCLYYYDGLQAYAEETFPESTGWNKPEITSFYSPGNTQIMYASTQLLAYLSTGDLDCLICDRSTLDYCRNSDLSLEYEDITDSPLGQAAKNLGIDPLYYVILTDSENAGAARQFLPAVRAFQPEAG